MPILISLFILGVEGTSTTTPFTSHVLDELKMIPFSQLGLPQQKLRTVDTLFVSELSKKAFDASTIFLVQQCAEGQDKYDVDDGTHRYLAFAHKHPDTLVRCTVLKPSTTEIDRFADARQRNHVAHCVRLNHFCDHLQAFSFYASTAINDSESIKTQFTNGTLSSNALNVYLGSPGTLEKFRSLLDEQVHLKSANSVCFQRWIQLNDLLIDRNKECTTEASINNALTTASSGISSSSVYTFSDFILVNNFFPKLSLSALNDLLVFTDESEVSSSARYSRRTRGPEETARIRQAIHLFAS